MLVVFNFDQGTQFFQLGDDFFTGHEAIESGDSDLHDDREQLREDLDVAEDRINELEAECDRLSAWIDFAVAALNRGEADAALSGLQGCLIHENGPPA